MLDGMDLPWIPVGGSSLDTRTVVSLKFRNHWQVLDNVRTRNMVCDHPPTRQNHWSGSSLRLFIDRRSVDVAVQVHNTKASQFQILGYVPYQMWAEADPRVITLLRNSMRSFRHELLISNFKGIPIMQQHGGADDNVPAFHSRRMNQLISQMNTHSDHQYVELEGKGHWFDGVMTTAPLLEFYDILGRKADRPRLPEEFTIMIANPADMGARGGLIVDQLLNPDQFGRINVERHPTSKSWVLRTSNILRFHFVPTQYSDIEPHTLIVDQCPLELPIWKEKLDWWLVRFEQGLWHVRKLIAQIFDPRSHASRYLTIASGSWNNVAVRN